MQNDVIHLFQKSQCKINLNAFPELRLLPKQKYAYFINHL